MLSMFEITLGNWPPVCRPGATGGLGWGLGWGGLRHGCLGQTASCESRPVLGDRLIKEALD